MNNQMIAAFRMEEVQKEMQEKLMVSDDRNAKKIETNTRNRLKMARAFVTASVQVLDFIVEHSSPKMLEYLMNPSNYHTARRTRYMAEYLLGDQGLDIRSYGVIRDCLNRMKRSSAVSWSRHELAALFDRDPSFTTNFIKSLYFFKLIETTAVRNENLITSINKHDTFWTNDEFHHKFGS